ncbi:hypothetical protein L6452_04064 [Arctium lappa]|uniref:Uncharacterized protein n=1 Tax=Arctium lappa TaxID=4217 RepID=A0ACB9FPY9_ARCLA|nr:hypothetical protein L6452_04064 [Arctium lappa]
MASRFFLSLTWYKYLLLILSPTFTFNCVNQSPYHRTNFLSLSPPLLSNLRDRDRERAQARAGGKSKQPKTDGLTPEQRRERDAKALKEKLARKSAKESSGGNDVKNVSGFKTKK